MTQTNNFNTETYSVKRFLTTISHVTKRKKHKSIYVQGTHGIGKTSIIEKIAREKAEKAGKIFLDKRNVDPESIRILANGKSKDECNVNSDKVWFDPKIHYLFYNIRTSQRDAVDFIGAISSKHGISEFIPVDWIVAFSQPDLHGMLFFDEIDQANKQVLSAIFEIIQDRSINSQEISENISIFAAGNSNTGQNIYGLKSLSAALIDRFWVCNFQPTVQEWIDWANNRTLAHKVIANLIKDNNHLLDYPINNVNSNAVFQTRRSWDSFAEDLNLFIEDGGMTVSYEEESGAYILSEFDENVIYDIAAGYLGQQTALSVKSWCLNARPSISLEEVLDGSYDPEKMKIPDCLNVIKAVFANINDYVTLSGHSSGGTSIYSIRKERAEDVVKIAKMFEEAYVKNHSIAQAVEQEMIRFMATENEFSSKIKPLVAKGGLEKFNNPNEQDGLFHDILAQNNNNTMFSGDKYTVHFTPKLSNWAKAKFSKLSSFNEERTTLMPSDLEVMQIGESQSPEAIEIDE